MDQSDHIGWATSFEDPDLIPFISVFFLAFPSRQAGPPLLVQNVVNSSMLWGVMYVYRFIFAQRMGETVTRRGIARMKAKVLQSQSSIASPAVEISMSAHHGLRNRRTGMMEMQTERRIFLRKLREILGQLSILVSEDGSSVYTNAATTAKPAIKMAESSKHLYWKLFAKFEFLQSGLLLITTQQALVSQLGTKTSRASSSMLPSPIPIRIDIA